MLYKENRLNFNFNIYIYILFIALSLFDYGFSENGLTAYKKNNLIHSGSFIESIGEEKYQQLVNYILHYLADLKIPKKRGTFIEFRKGMINVSPIGRNCSYDERLEFEKYDLENGIRKDLVSSLEKKFPDLPLKYSIGGQISIDIFPKGWDKTYCLNHIVNENFKEIHFFGDKTEFGGNDYEIFHHPKVIGHAVKSPLDTIQLIKKLFL